MAHGKKRAKDKRAAHATGAPTHHGEGKRRRQVQGKDKRPSSAPSAAFLAALEAQRANQNNLVGPQHQRPHADAVPHNHAPTTAEPMDPPIPVRAALPGFYYDEVKGRYFKATKQHQQQEKQKQRTQASSREANERKQQQLLAMRNGPCTRRRGWMGYLAAREFLAVGAVHHRDHRELVPLFFASRFVRSIILSVYV
jgi:hypothetical protein